MYSCLKHGWSHLLTPCANCYKDRHDDIVSDRSATHNGIYEGMKTTSTSNITYDPTYRGPTPGGIIPQTNQDKIDLLGRFLEMDKQNSNVTIKTLDTGWIVSYHNKEHAVGDYSSLLVLLHKILVKEEK